jgi:hypothetical protein
MNTEIQAARLIGAIEVEPSAALADVARVLGLALGLVFVEEQSGKYEEYPAWISNGCGLEFALLGPPAPEDDVREEQSQSFQLLIDSPWLESGGESVDISALYVDIIQRASDLSCAAL